MDELAKSVIVLGPEKTAQIKAAAHTFSGPNFSVIKDLKHEIMHDPNLTQIEQSRLLIESEHTFTDELVTEAKSRVKDTTKKLVEEKNGSNADELIQKLFAKNKAIAFADAHLSKEEHEYLIKHITQWKKDYRLEAVGIEFPTSL